MTTDLATPKVAIDRIDIVEDFNARKSFDKEDLKQMARTIEDTGIVQPVKVKQKENGRFDLVAEEHEELMQRALDAFYGYKLHNPTDAEVCLAEPEIDAARAAGVLLEHHEENYTRAFILDRELAVDLAGRAIERASRDREEKAKLKEEEEARLKEQRKADRRQANKERKDNGEPSPQAKADAEYAVRCNEAVGRNLLERRSGGKDKKHALRRAKLVAHLLVDQNSDLAGRGLRFTLDKLRDVERTPLKKGGHKEKVTYATDEECTAELRRRIDGARNEIEVMEVVTEAILAAELADNKAEPASRRPQWIGSYEKGKETEKILKAELKEARLVSRAARVRIPPGASSEGGMGTRIALHRRIGAGPTAPLPGRQLRAASLTSEVPSLALSLSLSACSRPTSLAVSSAPWPASLAPSTACSAT